MNQLVSFANLDQWSLVPAGVALIMKDGAIRGKEVEWLWWCSQWSELPSTHLFFNTERVSSAQVSEKLYMLQRYIYSDVTESLRRPTGTFKTNIRAPPHGNQTRNQVIVTWISYQLSYVVQSVGEQLLSEIRCVRNSYAFGHSCVG